MKLIPGVYENLINKEIVDEKTAIQNQGLVCKELPIDSAEQPRMLADYLSDAIKKRLDDESLSLSDRIKLANKILKDTGDVPEEQYLQDTENILSAVVTKQENARLEATQSEIVRPQTGFRLSNLFTGRQSAIPLNEEICRDIASADHIYLIVSFLRLSGIRLLMDALRKFTAQEGHTLQIITTTYCGITDGKAIQQLSELPNTQIKISYNTNIERLHAKAYIFERNSGYSTAYIGSSNLSKSAQTEGLEWNVRVTNIENPQVINAAIKTFEVYWNSKEFEDFSEGGLEKFNKERSLQFQEGSNVVYQRYSVLPHQKVILDKLQVIRKEQHLYRNLVVAATGTGKTVISAFDYQHFLQSKPQARLLFIAHREEILKQACHTYRSVLGDYNFGELWVGNFSPSNSLDHLFVSVATFNNHVDEFKQLGSNYYDYIVIDEAHHSQASSYRALFEIFSPHILMGLTATPERMDGQSLLPDFGGRISTEIRLPQALQEGLLTPFQYLCITDSVDLRAEDLWDGSKYFVNKLSPVLCNPERVEMICRKLSQYLPDEHDCKALCYCVDKKHAEFMEKEFIRRGFKARSLTSNNSVEREQLNQDLADGKINYLFVVDIFNEGVDIPSVDTLLLLRPTESLTIFLQQLGRGLRLSVGKSILTVLDFVAQVNKQYDFASRFRALLTRPTVNIEEQAKQGFTMIPHGCSIYMEEKAQQYVLENIKAAIYNTTRLQRTLASYSETPTISQFLESNGQDIRLLYKNNCWTRLKRLAGKVTYQEDFYTALYEKSMGNFCHVNSIGYINFIQRCIASNFHYEPEDATYALMLYYALYNTKLSKTAFGTIQEALSKFGKYPLFVQELTELVEYLEQHLTHETESIGFGLKPELELYGCYSKDEIFILLGAQTETKTMQGFPAGVYNSEESNAEVFFVTLNKSDKDFSPETQYKDYLISEDKFHWQSQGSESHTNKGIRYTQQSSNGKRFLLFVREDKKDGFGNTSPFYCFGFVDYISSQGDFPMSITWRLEKPALPMFLKAL